MKETAVPGSIATFNIQPSQLNSIAHIKKVLGGDVKERIKALVLPLVVLGGLLGFFFDYLAFAYGIFFYIGTQAVSYAIFPEAFSVPFLMYGSYTVTKKKKVALGFMALIIVAGILETLYQLGMI